MLGIRGKFGGNFWRRYLILAYWLMNLHRYMRGALPAPGDYLSGKLLAEMTHSNNTKDAVIYFPCDPLESGDLRGIRGE